MTYLDSADYDLDLEPVDDDGDDQPVAVEFPEIDDDDEVCDDFWLPGTLPVDVAMSMWS